jgi:hypothetical protein
VTSTTQLEGTENRIQVARCRLRKSGASLQCQDSALPNQHIGCTIRVSKTFPYFNADQGAEQAPSVDFNTPEPTN